MGAAMRTALTVLSVGGLVSGVLLILLGRDPALALTLIGVGALAWIMDTRL